MSKYLITLILLAPSLLLASSYHCYASKSLITYDPDTGVITTRLAKTASFNVTDQEHEEAKTFYFVDENKKRWGQVDVSTGAFKFEEKNYYHANATMVNKDNNISAFLTIKFSAVLKDQIDANTIILDPLEDISPNLSLTCLKKE